MKKLISLLAALLISGQVYAYTSYSDVKMNGYVVNECTVITSPTFNYVNIVGSTQTTLRASNRLIVNCNSGISYYVDTTQDNYPVELTNGVIAGFQPFLDAAYTQSAYYDGATRPGTVKTGTGANQAHWFYGQLSGNLTGTAWTPIVGLRGGVLPTTVLTGSIVISY